AWLHRWWRCPLRRRWSGWRRGPGRPVRTRRWGRWPTGPGSSDGCGSWRGLLVPILVEEPAGGLAGGHTVSARELTSLAGRIGNNGTFIRDRDNPRRAVAKPPPEPVLDYLAEVAGTRSPPARRSASKLAPRLRSSHNK